VSKGRMPKYGAKRDKTDPAIRDALRECGCTVLPLSQEKIPDMAVYNRVLHRWFIIDAKSKGGKPTEHQNWDETIEPDAIPFCETIEEAFAACRVSLIGRATVGAMEVLTSFADGGYYTIVYVFGAETPPLATRKASTYEAARRLHDAMKIAAMNYRDFLTPFSEARMP
jgi:hypothetical protein